MGTFGAQMPALLLGYNIANSLSLSIMMYVAVAATVAIGTCPLIQLRHPLGRNGSCPNKVYVCYNSSSGSPLTLSQQQF